MVCVCVSFVYVQKVVVGNNDWWWWNEYNRIWQVKQKLIIFPSSECIMARVVIIVEIGAVIF
jgi:hypothetical protein